MALNLSMTTINEKNRLHSDGAWLVMLEIRFAGETLNFVRNTVDVQWDGRSWSAFPFELDDIEENSKGELPELTIKIANQSRQAQKYIREVGGGVGAVVALYVVDSNHMNIVEPDFESEFIVKKTEADENWVYFTLGGDDSTNSRFPRRRILKDNCPFVYKGIECGYVGDLTTCKRTLLDCRNHSNQIRFGGEYTLPLGGTYVSNS